MHPRPDRRPFWSPDGSKLGFLSKRNNDDWEKTKEEWNEMSWEDSNDKKSDADSTVDNIIRIDTTDLYERLVQVTSLVGDEDDLLISKDGNHFYFTSISGLDKGNKPTHAFYEIKWDGTEPKKLIDNQTMYGLKWNKKIRFYYQFNGQHLKHNIYLPDKSISQGPKLEDR